MTAASDITALVKGLYTKFPYPHYPLLASLKWADGYLASSSFASQLTGVGDSSSPNILLAGCGEALPYIIRKWEPYSRHIVCADLSSSSISRARFRLLADPRPATFVCEDLTTLLPRLAGTFSHVDSIGVLHHLAEPNLVLNLLAKSLRPGATARIMVYNTEARRWIRDISKSFRLLKLAPYSRNDLETARRILRLLSLHSPALAGTLKNMGPSILRSDTRLVDTFFHFREINFDARAWYAGFERAGFQVEGLFDRYAELDDLPNPLWHPPKADELDRRATQRGFENNLELFLTYKKRAGRSISDAPSELRMTRERKFPLHRMYCFLRRPPRYWFDYQETRNVPTLLRAKLWYRYLTHLFVSPAPIDDLSPLFKLATLQRLARIGAIMPTQITSSTLKKRLAEPIEARDPMDTSLPDPVAVAEVEELRNLARNQLVRAGVFSDKKLAQVLLRWNRAQV
ncbi:MAG: class I SAM-dependent methyltransferase [Oligoflexales bacterium]